MKTEYERLKKEIAYHSHRYYVLDNPEITDAQYDQMMRRLQEIEKENPDWVTPDSPSQKIGGTVLSEFKQVTHSVKMESLQDAFDEGELIGTGAVSVVSGPKGKRNNSLRSRILC